MLKKKRFLIGGIIVVLAIGYLGFMGFQSAATYYYTVSEVTGQEASTYDENLRVSGKVVPDSVEQESGGFTLRFTISDDIKSLPVVYHGVVPDTFKAGNEVVVEGRLDSDGTFQANILMTKCPSKYEPEG